MRIRETAKTIHRASEQALAWSPIVQPNDAPQGGGRCVPTARWATRARRSTGQTWGTVYDTINYTTTGALGDWFDSSVGLGADGIDNEMSFSHLDKNIVFDPHTEQLHVDGNKALIYAHLAEIVDRRSPGRSTPGRRKGFVPNERLTREEQVTSRRRAAAAGADRVRRPTSDPPPDALSLPGWTRTRRTAAFPPHLANVLGVLRNGGGQQVDAAGGMQGLRGPSRRQDARDKDWSSCTRRRRTSTSSRSTPAGLVTMVNWLQAVSAERDAGRLAGGLGRARRGCPDADQLHQGPGLAGR